MRRALVEPEGSTGIYKQTTEVLEMQSKVCQFIHHSEWFCSNMSRTEAEVLFIKVFNAKKFLENAKPGDFVVRDSSVQSNSNTRVLVVSYKSKNEHILHSKILVNQNLLT